MRKMYLFLVSLFMFCQWSVAQTMEDKELQSLIEAVRMLRHSHEDTFTKVSQLFSADYQWTSMTELGVRQQTECLPSDKVPGFKLNRILTKAEGERKYVYTHGDMLNGEDERYNYSLYERSLKAGEEVCYQLKGREGAQVFALIPFKGKEAAFSGYLQIGSAEPVKFASVGTDEDLLYAFLQSPSLNRETTISITIKNHSGENQSFVIVNHNTRK